MGRGLRLLLAGVIGVVMIGVLVAMVASVGIGRGGWGPTLFWDGLLQRGPGTRIEMERTLPLSGERLSVRNPLGRVTITGGGALGEAKLVARTRVRQNDQQFELEDFLEIDTSSAGTTVDARRGLADRMQFFGFSFGDGAAVDMELTVPDGLMIDVNADVGRVEIDQVQGDVSVTADLGEVRVETFEGDLDVETDLGAIRVESAQIRDRLRLKTDMGSIRFSGVPGSEADVQSNMGSVRMALPPNRSYVVNVRTDLGSVDYDLPHADGRVGSGELSGRLTITTDLGSIRIEEAR